MSEYLWVHRGTISRLVSTPGPNMRSNSTLTPVAVQHPMLLEAIVRPDEVLVIGDAEQHAFKLTLPIIGPESRLQILDEITDLTNVLDGTIWNTPECSYRFKIKKIVDDTKRYNSCIHPFFTAIAVEC